MLTFNEAQIWAWVSPVLWPFLRVLALMGAMPVFAQRSVPVRVRVALSFLIALAVAFSSSFQTWATRKALAGTPGLKVTVGSARMVLTISAWPCWILR